MIVASIASNPDDRASATALRSGWCSRSRSPRPRGQHLAAVRGASSRSSAWSTRWSGRPRSRPAASRSSTARRPEEVVSLERAFHAMLERLEAERRDARERRAARPGGGARAIARDLHDEVNQALTGAAAAARGGRRQAPPPSWPRELAETGALANQAMGELLDLARQLRPTALDDLGLKAALGDARRGVRAARPASPPASRPRRARRRCPTTSSSSSTGSPRRRSSNVARHAGAEHVRGPPDRRRRRRDRAAGHRRRRRLRLRRAPANGLGLAGMRERALLVRRRADGRVRARRRDAGNAPGLRCR